MLKYNYDLTFFEKKKNKNKKKGKTLVDHGGSLAVGLLLHHRPPLVHIHRPTNLTILYLQLGARIGSTR